MTEQLEVSEATIISLPANRLVPSHRTLEYAGEVSYTTLWRWVKAGTFPPPVRKGRRVFWRLIDIHNWLAEQSG